MTMYCPECGLKIDEKDVRFCPECGTEIEEFEQQDAMKMHSVESNEEMYAYGLIFTNVKKLAAKMNTEECTIKNLLENFIDAKKSFGVSYQLVDAGNYTYLKRNLLGLSKTVHLDESNDLWDYMDILMDIHNHEQNKALPESQYLFIIGGDDIIPMPCVRHYSTEVRDKSIDTDILYAYPYGSDMLSKLENQQIFKYDQLFFVGRLPIAEDTTLDDFYNHLERNLQNSWGIPVTEAYGQCDPNWKNVSATVATDLIENSLLRNFDGRLSGDCYFRRLILSPMVTAEDVHQIFHSDASLFYFNLHGGDAMESRGYFGAPLSANGMYCTLLPEHMATCRVPNVVMCEACYGARFIGMDKHHSMLLTSLYTASLLFVGSSRIAWGNVDPTHSISGYTPVTPYFADVIAMGFIGGLLSGYTAGQAMFLARSMVLNQDNEGMPNTAATIVEFNLFGDPTLGLAVSDAAKSARKPIDKSACKVKSAEFGCVMEKIELNEGNSSGSILQQVRRVVDQNLAQIHDMVSSYLYAQYGISPRQASTISRMKYVNGRQELSFCYEVSNEQIPVTYIVRTSEKGEIKSVITTK